MPGLQSTDLLAFGLVLAVIASTALNAGYLLQHLGGSKVPAISPRRPLESLRGLGGSRLWLIGTATGLLGSLMHVGALAAAPLTLVQAFSAGGLAVTAPVASRLAGLRLRGSERLGVVVILVALGALAMRPATATAITRVAVLGWIGFLAVALIAAAGLAALPGGRRSAGLGLAAGLLYGVSDAATKGFTDALQRGLWAALASPWPPIVLVLCAAAFFALQRGLQLGPVVTVVVLMTAATNVTAVLAGVVLFGETLGASTLLIVVHTAAMAAVGSAAWWLSATQARLGEPGDIKPAAGSAPQLRRTQSGAPA